MASSLQRDIESFQNQMTRLGEDMNQLHLAGASIDFYKGEILMKAKKEYEKFASKHKKKWKYSGGLQGVYRDYFGIKSYAQAEQLILVFINKNIADRAGVKVDDEQTPAQYIEAVQNTIQQEYMTKYDEWYHALEQTALREADAQAISQAVARRKPQVDSTESAEDGTDAPEGQGDAGTDPKQLELQKLMDELRVAPSEDTFTEKFIQAWLQYKDLGYQSDDIVNEFAELFDACDYSGADVRICEVILDGVPLSLVKMPTLGYHELQDIQVAMGSFKNVDKKIKERLGESIVVDFRKALGEGNNKALEYVYSLVKRAAQGDLANEILVALREASVELLDEKQEVVEPPEQPRRPEFLNVNENDGDATQIRISPRTLKRMYNGLSGLIDLMLPTMTVQDVKIVCDEIVQLMDQEEVAGEEFDFDGMDLSDYNFMMNNKVVWENNLSLECEGYEGRVLEILQAVFQRRQDE